MSQNALSAQGTLIARQPQSGGGYTTIGELRDITAPALTRNPIELTSHNDLDEFFAVGIRRKGELTFQIGFIPTNATHGHLTGLIKAYNDADRSSWRITFPDGSTWIFDGFVTNVGPAMPVDDGLVADISVRPTGAFTFA